MGNPNLVSEEYLTIFSTNTTPLTNEDITWNPPFQGPSPESIFSPPPPPVIRDVPSLPPLNEPVVYNQEPDPGLLDKPKALPTPGSVTTKSNTTIQEQIDDMIKTIVPLVPDDFDPKTGLLMESRNRFKGQHAETFTNTESLTVAPSRKIDATEEIPSQNIEFKGITPPPGSETTLMTPGNDKGYLIGNQNYINFKLIKSFSSNLFEVTVFDDIPNTIPASSYCAGFDFPGYGFGLEWNEAYRTHVVKSPNYPKEFKLTWLENEDIDVYKFHDTWIKSLFDFTTKKVYANGLPKKNVTVVMQKFTADGTGLTTVLTFKMKGVAVKDNYPISAGWDKTGTEVKVDITYTFDTFEIS